MRPGEREVLLNAIIRACGTGAAEAEFDGSELRRRFFPVVDHLRVLDPETRIVIGPKGSGKSELFLALSDDSLRKVLVKLAATERRPAPRFERTRWVAGFTVTGQTFPPAELLENAFKVLGDDFRYVWLGLLVQALRESGLITNSQLPKRLVVALNNARYEIVELVKTVRQPEITAPLYAALDALDRRLIDGDEWVILSYDDLDAISPSDWQVVDGAVRALAQSWSVQARRFRRIQPKIFVRRDIFDRAATGPDIAKLALGGVGLEWSVEAVYGMLFKRLLNGEPALRRYLAPARIATRTDSVLGRVPEVSSEAGFSKAIERLIGRYMGPDFRKGHTLRWIPNHLKDGNGELFPRPAVNLIREAAAIELRNRRADGPRLLHHTSLREALDRVSQQRVNELRTEFPWIGAVRDRLAGAGLVVPVDHRDVTQLLDAPWPSDSKPPTTSGESLVFHLIDLGIAQWRADGRFDVGDLYLRGLGLKRKGGVARPRPVRTMRSPA